MRGLKQHVIRCSCEGHCTSRAVCPANEGIETKDGDFVMRRMLKLAARSAPLMRGLKLYRHAALGVVEIHAARSAPLMRGLKLEYPI